MLIVHKAYCGACRILIPNLKTSDDVKKLSENFVMVNAYDGQDPNAKLYAPDGAYVPRFVSFILFVTKTAVSKEKALEEISSFDSCRLSIEVLDLIKFCLRNGRQSSDSISPLKY